MKFLSRLVLFMTITGMLVFAPFTASAKSSGSEQGDIVRMSGDIHVDAGTTVNGNVVTMSGDVFVDGTVTGDAVSLFGDVNVDNGKVMGDAVSVSGKVIVGQNGKIMGNTVEALGGNFNIDRNFDFNYNYTPHINIPFRGFRISNIIFSLIFTLVMFGVAAVVYLIMPDKIERMASTLEPNLGKRIGIGFLTLIGSPIAMIIASIILAITIIGIIVIPFAWIGYALMIFVSIVPVYLYIGRKAGLLFTKQRMSGYASIAIGMSALWIINTIATLGGFYTGWINWIISIGLFVLGTGTMLDFLFSNRKRKPAYAPYPPYPPYPPQGGGPNPGYTAPQPQENNTYKENSEDNISKDDDKHENE